MGSKDGTPSLQTDPRRQSRRSLAEVADVIATSATALSQTILRLTDGSPEIKYNTSYNWPPYQIIKYLMDNSFSIPGDSKKEKTFVTITSAHGVETVLPQKYRIPLMFVAQFQWTSLKINLPPNADTWDEWKYDILHLSILCSTFLAYAREEKARGRMHKGWRWSVFDRPLIRFYHGWLLVRPDGINGLGGVKEFDKEFPQTIYAPHKDILEENWRSIVLKGHKGFQLTKEQIQNGVQASEFYRGLRLVEGGSPSWPDDEEQHTEESRVNDSPNPILSENLMDVDALPRDSTPTRESSYTPSPTSPNPARETSGQPNLSLSSEPASTSQLMQQQPSQSQGTHPDEASPSDPANGSEDGLIVPPANSLQDPYYALTNGAMDASPSAAVPQTNDLGNTKEAIASLLTHIFSTDPPEESIPKAVDVLVTILEAERTQFDERLTQCIVNREQSAQFRVDQIVVEMQQRECRLLRDINHALEEREERVLGEIRKLVQGQR